MRVTCPSCKKTNLVENLKSTSKCIYCHTLLKKSDNHNSSRISRSTESRTREDTDDDFLTGVVAGAAIAAAVSSIDDDDCCKSSDDYDGGGGDFGGGGSDSDW